MPFEEAMEVGYIDKKIGKQWISETKEISAMLIGLIKAVGREDQSSGGREKQ